MSKKKIISLEVRDEYILGSGVAIGAVGSHASILLHIKFNENWDALNIHATWMDALGNVGEDYNQLLLPSHKVEERTYEIGVPAFATRHSGTVRLSFSGFAIGEDGEEISQVINTASGLFKVLDSNAVRLDDERINATYEEQVQAELNAFDERMTAFEDEMDAWEKDLGEAEERRDAAEEQRQINEFGAVRNHWNDDETAIVDADGNEVALDAAGRVGAELLRREAEVKRNAVIGDIEKALDDIISIQDAFIEGGVTVNVPIPIAAETDDGKILSVEDGKYVLKDIGDSSVKSYVDEYIESALGGDY